jgi:hypothetical protein
MNAVTMDELSAIELEEAELEKKQQAVKEALGKFNFFLHLTTWLSGCSFLLIMGILIPSALPYVFVPIGLWTGGLAYHGFKAFRPRRKPV